MAWIEDPQGREDIDKVTDNLMLPLPKKSSKAKIIDIFKEVWGKLDTAIKSLTDNKADKTAVYTKGETDGKVNAKYDKTGGKITGDLRAVNADIGAKAFKLYSWPGSEYGDSNKFIRFWYGNKQRALSIDSYNGQGGEIERVIVSGKELAIKGDSYTKAEADAKLNTKLNLAGGNITGNLTVKGVPVMTGATVLPKNTDLNNIKTPGLYCNPANVDVNTMSNTPNKLAFSLQVYQSAGLTQVWYQYNSSYVFVRSLYDSWTPWRRLALAEEVNVSNSIFPYHTINPNGAWKLPNIPNWAKYAELTIEGLFTNQVTINLNKEPLKPFLLAGSTATGFLLLSYNDDTKIIKFTNELGGDAPYIVVQEIRYFV